MIKEYNHEEYIHFREIYDDNGKAIRIDFPFEDIASINLEKVSKQAPEMGFVPVANYTLKYWSSIIGCEAIMMLSLLKMNSSPNGEYTCVSVTELSLTVGKSVNTVKKYLRALEEHGFIAMFRRFHIYENNRETSPYIKIRLTVPMLTEEQVLSLPKFLQEEHRMYLEQMKAEGLM